MDSFVLRFLKASLGWLVLGVTLGVAMAIVPVWVRYRPAHLHMLLLGFVTMMISGVAYHVFPRFASTPLYSARLATIHLWLANVGLVLMVCGFVARAHGVMHAGSLLGLGGVMSALGAYALGWNLWQTLRRAAMLPSRLPPVRPMPVVDRPGAA